MVKKLSRKIILTGDRPTGPLHLGHYAGSHANRVKLQDEYECYFIIADYQVITEFADQTDKIEANIKELVLDYLSIGIDPYKSTIFIQSMIPEIAELTFFFSTLVTLPRLQRNPTVKEEFNSTSKGKKEMSYGFLGYPISQAADILCIRADLVPVGEDQLPHIEQAREIARSFNNAFKQKVFPEPQALLGNFPRLPGIDRQKMSKSRGNAIFLTDSSEEVEKKVMKTYTDPARKKATDPGHLEGNVVFDYLEAFHADNKGLQALKKTYQEGGIGDVEVKKILIKTLNDFLDPIREKRKEYQSKPKLIRDIITEGNQKTKRRAAATLKLAKEAMKFNYKNIL